MPFTGAAFPFAVAAANEAEGEGATEAEGAAEAEDDGPASSLARLGLRLKLGNQATGNHKKKKTNHQNQQYPKEFST